MSIMSSKLVTGGILALIGLVTLKVIMFVVGGAFAILGLVFKLLPIAIILFVAWKLLRHLGRTDTAES